MKKEDAPLVTGGLPNYCPRCRAPLQLDGQCVMWRVDGCQGRRIEHLEPRSSQIPYSCRRGPSSPQSRSAISLQVPVPPARITASHEPDQEFRRELEQVLDSLDTSSQPTEPKVAVAAPVRRSPTDSGTYQITATTLRRPAPPKKPNDSG